MPNTGIVVAFPMGEQLVSNYAILVDEKDSDQHFNTTEEALQFLQEHPILLNDEYILLEHAFCWKCGKHHYLTRQQLIKTSDKTTYSCPCGNIMYFN